MGLAWAECKLTRRAVQAVLGVSLSASIAGCTLFSTEPKPGPDKQAVGTMAGAAVGAGSGAAIGANIGRSTGPGAWVGAGFGALFGMLSGLGIDLLEEDQLRRFDETERAKEQLWAQEMLAEHYARRLELHPNRDIFPADWFFDADSSQLKPEAVILSRELGELTRQRMPWSRIVVAVYVTSQDPESAYAQYVTKQRAQEIVNEHRPQRQLPPRPPAHAHVRVLDYPLAAVLHVLHEGMVANAQPADVVHLL